MAAMAAPWSHAASRQRWMSSGVINGLAPSWTRTMSMSSSRRQLRPARTESCRLLPPPVTVMAWSARLYSVRRRRLSAMRSGGTVTTICWMEGVAAKAPDGMDQDGDAGQAMVLFGVAQTHSGSVSGGGNNNGGRWHGRGRKLQVLVYLKSCGGHEAP